jgi:hypothetical protein
MLLKVTISQNNVKWTCTNLALKGSFNKCSICITENGKNKMHELKQSILNRWGG